MSLHWTKRIWTSPELSKPTERLLLLALADHANEEGVCWPSVNRLAKMCCISSRHVYTILASLEEQGFICRTARPGRSNLYTLLVPSKNDGLQQQRERGNNDEQVFRAPMNGHSRGYEQEFIPPTNGSSHRTTNEPSSEPLNEPPLAGSGDDFALINALRERGLMHNVERFVATHPQSEICKQIQHYDYLASTGKCPDSPGWIVAAVKNKFRIPRHVIASGSDTLLTYEEAFSEYKRITGGGDQSRPFNIYYETLKDNDGKASFRRRQRALAALNI